MGTSTSTTGPVSFPAPATGSPPPPPRAPPRPPMAVPMGAEMVASATYMRLWFPHVPAILWVFVFSAFLLFINFLAVHTYGRFEFWFAMIKVAVIPTFIALGAALLLTGRAAPQYTAHGGFFPLGPAPPPPPI